MMLLTVFFLCESVDKEIVKETTTSKTNEKVKLNVRKRDRIQWHPFFPIYSVFFLTGETCKCVIHLCANLIGLNLTKVTTNNLCVLNDKISNHGLSIIGF